MFAERAAGRTAVTTLERFVMLGAVFIEAAPTLPSIEDPLTVERKTSAVVCSKWTFWHTYSFNRCDINIRLSQGRIGAPLKIILNFHKKLSFIIFNSEF